ncbi:hypothetical protein HUG15_12450 [Salicibibacter cibarius]|uniref:Uncharacterized protein n=1 Tax=Salicibibacter cibarius TaxID=2743000 RepID=A0A7T6Z3M2_9BACI|nr:hypothetical protein [Salicibibacter cibarius]QQK76284.1 hypothetical protein HUG15_12450 [Salicibibacter cibarius]
MSKKEYVTEWIEDVFGDLNEVTIEDYDHLPYGKKITDCTDDYVIVYYDDRKNRVSFIFKEK